MAKDDKKPSRKQDAQRNVSSDEEEVKSPPIFKSRGARTTIYLVIAVFVVIFVFQTGDQIVNWSQDEPAEVDGRNVEQDVVGCFGNVNDQLRLGLNLSEWDEDEQIREQALADGDSIDEANRRVEDERTMNNVIVSGILRFCIDVTRENEVLRTVGSKADILVSGDARRYTFNPVINEQFDILKEQRGSTPTMQIDQYIRRFKENAQELVPSKALTEVWLVSQKDMESRLAVQNTQVSVDIALITFRDYAHHLARTLPDDRQPSREALQEFYDGATLDKGPYIKEYLLKVIPTGSEEDADEILAEDSRLQSLDSESRGSVFDEDSEFASRIQDRTVSRGDADFQNVRDNLPASGIYNLPFQFDDGSWAVVRTVDTPKLSLDEIEEDESLWHQVTAEYFAVNPTDFVGEYDAWATETTQAILDQAKSSSMAEAASAYQIELAGRTQPFSLMPTESLRIAGETGDDELTIRLNEGEGSSIFNLRNSKAFMSAAVGLADGTWQALELLEPEFSVESRTAAGNERFSVVMGMPQVESTPMNESELDRLEQDWRNLYETAMFDATVASLSEIVDREYGMSFDIAAFQGSAGIDPSQMEQDYPTEQRQVAATLEDNFALTQILSQQNISTYEALKNEIFPSGP